MDNQKTFLIELEQICEIKKPVFINSEDTFAVGYENLVYAKNITVEHAIGRVRLTHENSAVCEIWIDVDNHDGLQWKQYKEDRLIPAINKLSSFGIPNECIFPKVSGRGVHLHVFVANLPFDVDPKEVWIKTTAKEADVRSKVEKTKLREFGALASTGNGYAGYVPIGDLLKARNLPVLKEPVYPDIKLFECTKQFLLALACAQMDRKQSAIEPDVLVDYDRDGDFMQLYKCPAIKHLAKTAEIDKHLRHNERFFLMSEFIHFGEDSRKHLHSIINYCADYDQWYTQGIIDHAMRSNYHPCTCRWAKEMGMPCPIDCKGSGGKSPIKFAWTPLALDEIKQEYRKILLLAPEDDDIIDISLAEILDPHITGDLSWMLLVAPPSWAKTVILTSIHDPKWSELIDMITDKTFISGKTKFDPILKQDVPIEGLLPKLHMRTLICKEFTTQLMKGEDIRNVIFGQMRAIYDCEYSQAFGSFDYKLMPEHWKHVRMGFFAGCTLYIDKYNTMNAILGERYLKIRMREPSRLVATKYARMGTKTKEDKIKMLRRKVKRFIANLIIPKTFNDPPEDIGNALDHLAEFVVQVRAPVERKKVAMEVIEYDYDDLKELPTRLVQQLQRIGWALTTVKNTKFDVEIYRLLVRIAMDTLHPNRKDLVLYLHSQDKPLDDGYIQKQLGWGHNRLKRTLTELQLIKVVDQTEIELYKLNDYVRMCLKNALQPLPSSSQGSHRTGLSSLSPVDIKNTLYYTIESCEFVGDDDNAGLNPACLRFSVNPDCPRCARLASCDLPALRRALMRMAVRCCGRECKRPDPRNPMTRWCVECVRKGRPFYAGAS